MKAVQIRGKGQSPSDLYVAEVDLPVPKPDEILIKVNYTGLNRADISQRMGKYPPPPGASDIMGLEASGTVYKLGENAEREAKWKIGDRVMALLDGGGYAEFTTCNQHVAMKVPSNLSLEDAACIPEVYLTGYQAFFFIGKLVEQGKKKVLIHAGASGVGSALIQLCKDAGCTHIVTTSSKGKTDFCKKLGATLAIAYDGDEVKNKQWSEIVQREIPDGVDLILDPVGGGTYIEQDISVCATDATIIGIACMGGSKTEGPINLQRMLGKRITITYSTLRSRSTRYKADLIDSFVKYTNNLSKFETGKLKPVKFKVFDGLEKMSEAHELMQNNANSGKIVVKVANE